MASRVVSVILQANIAAYISQLQRAAGATGSFGRSAASGFSIAGQGAALLGAASVGAVASIVRASTDFEKAMSAVHASTQASAGTMEDLRKAALKAGADTSFSATEAAGAITEMSKAGVSAADIMSGGLSGALSLAAAGQIDVADAASIASIAMTQFKLAGSDLPHVADLLAAGAGKANGSVHDLGEALNQAGLIASNAGLSIEDTTGVLAAFASAGLIGSDAGTSFKTMLQKMQNPSQESAKAMSDLGIAMYDANGNFVGITNLAGQLHDKLGGLTQAQRDQTLAQIFGSDAVRAATVLYQEGSGGIQNWIDKVDDSGYAAKQAGDLQDNLAGDLEKLGGSFDTLFIQLGGGAQGPLRSLVELFTGLINVVGEVVGWVSQLPGPVLAGVAALTALYLINGPLLTSLTLGAVALSGWFGRATAAAAANGILGASFAAVRGAASGVLGLFGGPWGIAITGVVVGLGYLVSWLTKTDDATEDTAQTQTELTAALQQSKGAIDANVRAAAAKEAADRGMLDAAKQAGIPLSQVTDAILGQGDAYSRTMGALALYRDANTDMSGNQTAGAQAANDARNALADLSGETATAIVSAQDLASATAETTAASGGATAQQQQLTTQLQATSDAADAARQATDLLKTSLDILTGQTVTMVQADAAFYEAVDSATGAVTDLSGSVLTSSGALDTHSEAGRKALEVLTNVAGAGNTLIATMEQQGATTEAVTAKDAQLRQSFIETEGRMGITGAAAEALADQIYGIPGSRSTVISADTTSAYNTVRDFVGGLQSIGFLRLAIPGHADGGHITGPGTGTSDSIPAMLSDGEFVVKASQTAKHLPLLHAINSGIAGYADGGLVDFTGYMRTTDAFNAQLAAARDARAGGAAKGAPSSVSGNAALGQQLAAARGWGSGVQWNDLYALWQRESGWRNTAQNPTSTAYGIPQFLNSTWASTGYKKTSDARTQILAGLQYIASRYGTPAGAWGHETRYGWYQDGTNFVPFDMPAFLHKGEAIVPAEDNARMRSREVSGGGWSGGSGWGGSPANVTVNARVFLGDRELTDIVRIEAEGVYTDGLTASMRRVRSN